jgi:addiction module RelE/StbE family toxin
MSLTVRFTRRALRRLDEIGGYIARDNPAAAARIVRAVAEQIASLKDMPTRGRPGRIEGTREFVINGTPYVVAYRVHDADIEILTIQHGAQDWPRTL